MTQQFVGVKIITAWPEPHPHKINVCGVDCHEGSDKCNGYCTGKADSPAPDKKPDGYAVKYEDGYRSFSPKEPFEKAYLPLGHIGHLAPHQQRLVAEHALLANNCQKLSVYLASEESETIDPLDKELLTQQLRVMEQYQNILTMRVSRLPAMPE
jgi:hypothetical protein